MFEETKTGKYLRYSPLELAEEFEKYLEDLRANPIEIKTTYKRQNKKEGKLTRNSEEKSMQDRVESLPRAPRVSDFVCRWLGKDMAWWSLLSQEKSHPNSWQQYQRVKFPITQYCRTSKLNGACVGIFNPVIIARELGLSEKQQIEQKSTQVVIQVQNEEEAERLKELADLE